MKKHRIDINHFLSWRRANLPLIITWLSGAPLVLTKSINGHDAESIHISISNLEHKINAGSWYTIETLGEKSEIGFMPNMLKEELAEKNWRPSPRRLVKQSI